MHELYDLDSSNKIWDSNRHNVIHEHHD